VALQGIMDRLCRISEEKPRSRRRLRQAEYGIKGNGGALRLVVSPTEFKARGSPTTATMGDSSKPDPFIWQVIIAGEMMSSSVRSHTGMGASHILWMPCYVMLIPNLPRRNIVHEN
jgi:hypothetical protein